MANIFIIFITLLAIANGTLLTYLVFNEISLRARVAAGSVVGLALLAWVAFLTALLFGLGAAAAGVTVALFVLDGFLLIRIIGMERILAELRRCKPGVGETAYYVAWTLLLAWLLGRVVMFTSDGLHTAPANNFGDLPFHFSVITSFAYGDNLPPQNPIFAGMKFTYPFLIDFLTAFFIRCGADWRAAFFVGNLPLALGLVCLLERLTWSIFHIRSAAMLAPMIFLFNGGLGFLNFFHDLSEQAGGWFDLLAHLPKAYTMNNELALASGAVPLRWGNVFTTLLLPQRSMLFGLPMAAMIIACWWKGVEEGEREGRRDGGIEGQRDRETKRHLSVSPSLRLSISHRRRYLLAAGLLAGLLPMLHAHGFFSIAIASVAMALLFFSWDWLWFFVPMGGLAAPQAFYLSGTQVRSKLFEFHLWWEADKANPLVFWLVNAGVFLLLLLAALLVKRMTTPEQARFYLPFALWFIVPNVVLLAPWPWDNIKMLVYWALASTPFVAFVLSDLFARRSFVVRGFALALLLILTLSGALDVARALSPVENVGLFSQDEVEVAALLREKTPPRSLIAHAPIHNSTVALSGRRSLMGYPGHLWTHGIEYAQREADLKTLFRGGVDGAKAMARLGVDYVVIGPRERSEMHPDENFFAASYPLVFEHAEYRVYDVRR